MENFNLFGSDNDMIILMKILSSLEHCTQLSSIVIYHCLLSNKWKENDRTMSVKDRFHQWLNDNTYLTFEGHFDTEYDEKHMTLKLWLK